MFICSYCSNEFQWYGLDYQVSANGSFCSPLCGNKSGIENEKPYRHWNFKASNMKNYIFDDENFPQMYSFLMYFYLLLCKKFYTYINEEV